VKKLICLDDFLGDGWFEKRGIAIATRAEDEAVTLATLIERVYGKAPKVKLRRYKDGHSVWWIRLWSSDVASKFAELLKCSGRKKSLNAKPPVEVLTWNSEAELCFLLGVLDAEAWVYIWRGRIRISAELYNESVTRYLVDILRRYGVKTSLSLNKDGAYRIDITGSHVYKFIKIIPKDIPAAVPRRVPAVNDAG
jgi:hypothetical protein